MNWRISVIFIFCLLLVAHRMGEVKQRKEVAQESLSKADRMPASVAQKSPPAVE